MSADPRFGVLREALASYASDPDDPTPAAAEILQAAVALVVRGGERLEVLLIKRAKREHDPWSGHMALPGGRRDPADASLLETAMRETREETGVALDDRGVHLGRLEEVRPQSARLPRLSVTPHVFGVPPETPAQKCHVYRHIFFWDAKLLAKIILDPVRPLNGAPYLTLVTNNVSGTVHRLHTAMGFVGGFIYRFDLL